MGILNTSPLTTSAYKCFHVGLSLASAVGFLEHSRRSLLKSRLFALIPPDIPQLVTLNTIKPAEIFVPFFHRFEV